MEESTIKQLVEKISHLEERLTKLEYECQQHQQISNYCPHTGI